MLETNSNKISNRETLAVSKQLNSRQLQYQNFLYNKVKRADITSRHRKKTGPALYNSTTGPWITSITKDSCWKKFIE